MTDVLTTGIDLKVQRIRRQVTGRALAERMGISTATLTRLEQRGAVQPDVAQRYRDALATFPALATPSDGQSAA